MIKRFWFVGIQIQEDGVVLLSGKFTLQRGYSPDLALLVVPMLIAPNGIDRSD